MKNGLPPGWIVASLEELTEQPRQDIVDGPFGSNLKASSYVATGVPILRLQNIDRNRFVDKNIRFVTLEKAAELCRHSFRAGDIIITKLGDPVGKACIVPPSLPEGIIVADVVRARIDQRKSLLQFVAYSINSPEVSSELNLEVKGSTRPGVNLRHIRSLKIPVAPLNEQRRIVAKLEKLLHKVDSCQKRLAKIPILLKRFRQAVLADACSGRLTEDWRERNPDVKSAIELFEKIQVERELRYENECREAMLNSRRKPKHPSSNKQSRSSVGALPELPDTWAYFRLDELCHLITDGTHKTPEYVSEGVMFLSVKNVRPFRVLTTDIKLISAAEHLAINTRCNPEKGDILYTKIGATFG